MLAVAEDTAVAWVVVEERVVEVMQLRETTLLVVAQILAVAVAEDITLRVLVILLQMAALEL